MKIPPLKAIRLKCLDCSGGLANEVRLCPCEDCPLYPYRFGKDPFRKKKELTDEQKAALSNRLQQYRESQAENSGLGSGHQN